MRTKIKSSLYFLSFFIATVTYYSTNQASDKQVAMEKEITKIENITVATQNATDMHNLQ